jgi:hypothetical protein
MNTCSLNRVRRRLEEKESIFLRGQRDHEHPQREPCRAAAVGRGKEEKKKVYFICTYSANRVRRRLWGEERNKRKVHFSEVNATMSTHSVNRVRWQLWGEEREKY